jgi:hypothetical protein
MPGIAGLREKRQIRKRKVPDNTGHAANGHGIGLPLKIGMGKHQAQKQQAGT